MGSFAALPAIPEEGVDANIQHWLRAATENIQLLTGQRGGDTGDRAALLRGQITLNALNTPRITASRGTTIDQLRQELQAALDDNAEMRAFINTLITILKGI